MNGLARIFYAKISSSATRWSDRCFGLGYRFLAVAKHFHTLASKPKR